MADSDEDTKLEQKQPTEEEIEKYEKMFSHTDSMPRKWEDVRDMIKRGEKPQVVIRRFTDALLASATESAAVRERSIKGLVTLRLPSDLLAKIDNVVAEGGAKNRSALIRKALETYLMFSAAADKGLELYIPTLLQAAGAFMDDPRHLVLYWLFVEILGTSAVKELLELTDSLRDPLSQIIGALRERRGQPAEEARNLMDRILDTKPD